MKDKVIKRITAAIVAVGMLDISVPEIPYLINVPNLFAVKASAETGSVTLDETTGVLTLHGNVTKEQIWAYMENTKVTDVVADNTCVLPKDCSELFFGFYCYWDGENNIEKYNWTNLKSIDLSKANTSNVTDMRCMFLGCNALTSLDVSNFDTSNVTDMWDMFYGCSTLTSLDVSGFNTANVTDMGSMFSDCSALTSLDVSGFNTENVTEMGDMFRGCSALTSLDVSGFDTSNVRNMNAMFYSCSGLTSLDVSNFDTSNVTNMGGMFEGCSELISIDLSGFDTSNVTSMGFMFDGCSELTSLDVSNFDTSNVTDMWDMFYGCSALTSLDVSKFNTSNVTRMYGMFCNCSALTSLDVSKFDTSNVTYMDGMFEGCSALTSLDVSKFNTSNVESMNGMFDGCSGLTSLDVSGFNTSKLRSMSGLFRMCSGLTSLDVSNFDTSNVRNMNAMFYSCSGLTSLNVSNFDTSYVTNMSYMFYNCPELTTIYVSDIWKTVNVTSSESMFLNCSKLKGGSGTVYNSDYTDKTYARIDVGASAPGYFSRKNAPGSVTLNESTGVLTLNGKVAKAQINEYRENTKVTDVVADNTCVLPADCSKLFSVLNGLNQVNKNYWTNLKSIDLSKADSSKVTNMHCMFAECSGLTLLDVSGFDTSNVTDMYGMFDGCSSLTSLNVSGFNTAKVADMGSMFRGCSALSSLDVSGFNTANVTSMFDMFNNCSSLTSLDVSKFNTSNVTNMLRMFNNCSSLTSLDVSGFNTSKVTSMSGLFGTCRGLTSLDVSNFDTSNVTDMNGMFNSCFGLTSLDISGFNTSNVTDMSFMFRWSENLETIYVGENWNTEKVTESEMMFDSCHRLSGGSGTVYNSDYTDKTYARIDGGASAPGYFTRKKSKESDNWNANFQYDENTGILSFDLPEDAEPGIEYQLDGGDYYIFSKGETSVNLNVEFAQAALSGRNTAPGMYEIKLRGFVRDENNNFNYVSESADSFTYEFKGIKESESDIVPKYELAQIHNAYNEVQIKIDLSDFTDASRIFGRYYSKSGSKTYIEYWNISSDYQYCTATVQVSDESYSLRLYVICSDGTVSKYVDVALSDAPGLPEFHANFQYDENTGMLSWDNYPDEDYNMYYYVYITNGETEYFGETVYRDYKINVPALFTKYYFKGTPFDPGVYDIVVYVGNSYNSSAVSDRYSFTYNGTQKSNSLLKPDVRMYYTSADKRNIRADLKNTDENAVAYIDIRKWNTSVNNADNTNFQLSAQELSQEGDVYKIYAIDKDGNFSEPYIGTLDDVSDYATENLWNANFQYDENTGILSFDLPEDAEPGIEYQLDGGDCYIFNKRETSVNLNVEFAQAALSGRNTAPGMYEIKLRGFVRDENNNFNYVSESADSFTYEFKGIKESESDIVPKYELSKTKNGNGVQINVDLSDFTDASRLFGQYYSKSGSKTGSTYWDISSEYRYYTTTEQISDKYYSLRLYVIYPDGTVSKYTEFDLSDAPEFPKFNANFQYDENTGMLSWDNYPDEDYNMYYYVYITNGETEYYGETDFYKEYKINVPALFTKYYLEGTPFDPGVYDIVVYVEKFGSHYAVSDSYSFTYNGTQKNDSLLKPDVRMYYTSANKRNIRADLKNTDENAVAYIDIRKWRTSVNNADNTNFQLSAQELSQEGDVYKVYAIDKYGNFSEPYIGTLDDVSELHTQIIQASAILDGEIGYCYHISVPEMIVNAGAVAVLNGANGEKRYTLSNEAKNSDGNYVLTYEVGAAQMSSNISLKIIDNSGSTLDLCDSDNNQCANNIFDDSVSNSLNKINNSKAKAELNYGAYAQIMLNGSTNIEHTVPSDVSADDLNDYELMFSGNTPSGVEIIGMTLVLNSNVDARLYFKLSGNVSEHSIALDKNQAEVKSQNGIYYVEIKNLSTGRYTEWHTINIDGYKVKFCALTYVYNVLNSSSASENLKNLARAMYEYINAFAE